MGSDGKIQICFDRSEGRAGVGSSCSRRQLRRQLSAVGAVSVQGHLAFTG